MNDDIRKISCLSCGGQLLVTPDQSITQCPYCGNTYLLKDLLDQTPLCPICKKSDRVVRASGINKDDPKYRVLRFTIKDFYLPGDEIELDDRSKTIGVLGWVLVIVPLILIQFFASRFSNQPLGCLIPLGISIVLGVGLFIYAVNQYNAVKEKKAQKENIREALKELNKIEFNRLKPIYDRLYYCRRDDMVFLPDAGDYAAPEEMRKYLRDHA
jgi:hypothetical protein